jgi:hypothetical protein
MPAAKTPLPVLITVALLAVLGAYAAMIAFNEHSWPLRVAALVACVGCVGAALMRRWSQWVVYALSLGYLLHWSNSVYAAVQAGYFGHELNRAVVRSLIPEGVLVLLCGYCCFAVCRQFARRAR